MEESEKKSDNETARTYFALISLIEGTENRLKWSELCYVFMNLIVFATLGIFIAMTIHDIGKPVNPIHLLVTFFCIAIGVSINTFWVASSMRLQLKLKLRYFQARFLERKLNRAGEFIFSDESLFFNPDIGKIESPDGKETTCYPKSGVLSMDGIIASAKPRMLSLLMPLLFFVIYLASLFSVAVMVVF